jgi:hypothetical protein
MLGHGFPLGAAAFGLGAVRDGAGAVGVVDRVLVPVVEVVLCGVVAAPALAMPADAPPVASAPATIVAPSSLEMDIGSNLLGSIAGTAVIVGDSAKPQRTRA